MASASAHCGSLSIASMARCSGSRSALPRRRAIPPISRGWLALKLDGLSTRPRSRLRLRLHRPCRHACREDLDPARRSRYPARCREHGGEASACLIDALRQRLGPESVRQLTRAKAIFPNAPKSPSRRMHDAAWPKPTRTSLRPLCFCRARKQPMSSPSFRTARRGTSAGAA